MRTKLTLLALLASTSFLVHAQSTAPAMSRNAAAGSVQSIPSGNEPLNMAPTTKTPSEETRGAVKGEASDAAKTGTISTGNQPLAPMVSPHSETTRAATRSEGVAAAQSGSIATGEKPIVGSSDYQAKMHKKSPRRNKAKSGSAAESRY